MYLPKVILTASAESMRASSIIRRTGSALLIPHNLHVIIFDDRVGKKLAAHGVKLGPGLLTVRRLKLHLDQLALTHILHIAKAQRMKRVCNCPALRIENAAF